MDNATGIAALLELGRMAAALRTDRSIVFLAVTAEEKGLLGSEYYAANSFIRCDDRGRPEHGRAQSDRSARDFTGTPGDGKVSLQDDSAVALKAHGRIAFTPDPAEASATSSARPLPVRQARRGHT